MDRERSVFFVQCTVLAIVVAVSAYNLTLRTDSKFDVWFNLLTNSLALLVPFPLNVDYARG